jgi:Uma2 family endonuclease
LVTRPDGTEDLEQIPLTLEDVLHPLEGDHIVQSDAHNNDRAYLQGVFKARLQHDTTAVVLADCGVNFNLPKIKPICPDIAVFFGVNRQITWNILNVAAENARPALIIEVTSKSTRSNDLGKKFDYYHRAKVPVYVIADAVGLGPKRRIKLLAFQYERKAYKPVELAADGRIYLEAVRVWLGVTRDLETRILRLACYEPGSDLELGDYVATRRELLAARMLVESEGRRADEERRRADEERRRADEERRRADEERHRADNALARIRELEAELKQARSRKV